MFLNGYSEEEIRIAMKTNQFTLKSDNSKIQSDSTGKIFHFTTLKYRHSSMDLRVEYLLTDGNCTVTIISASPEYVSTIVEAIEQQTGESGHIMGYTYYWKSSIGIITATLYEGRFTILCNSQ